MKSAIPFVLSLFIFVCPAQGDMPWHVSIDTSGLVGTDLELEFALYDNSEVLGDSWALIDNVTFGGVLENFEAGTIGGFDDSLNTPGTVSAVSGSLVGPGSFVMRMDEDPVFSSTIAFRDFAGSSATTLEFDLLFSGSDTVGFFGLDEFVVSLLDPFTLDPLLGGLTPDLGDVFAINADGAVFTDTVTAAVVPVPGAVLLGVVGLGCVGLLRRFH